jgi:hypothetical protein
VRNRETALLPQREDRAIDPTALSLSIDYTKQFKRFGDRLAKQKIAERKVLQIARELWPDNGSERQIRNAQARREAVLRLFTDSATIGNAPGTKWCAANALLEQLEWGSGARSPEGRFLRHSATWADSKPARSNSSSMRRARQTRGCPLRLASGHRPDNP